MKLIHFLWAALFVSVAINITQFVMVNKDCEESPAKTLCSRETAQWYLDCNSPFKTQKPADCDTEKLRETALDCKDEIAWEAGQRSKNTPKENPVILNDGKSY